MDTIFLWPERPALSLLAFFAISSLALWAARDPMRELFERLAKGLEDACASAGRRCGAAAGALHERATATLLAAGGLELQGRLEKEFPRVEAGFSERLGQYTLLHRKLEELLQRLEQDYQESGVSPPEVPGWTPAVESIAGLPRADDPNVKEILTGVQRSLDEAQRQALHAYRADAAERHAILDRTRSIWKEVRVALERTNDSVAGAVQTAERVNASIDAYARVRDSDLEAARALSYSAAKRFGIAGLVLLAALGGAFANVQLLVPALAERLPEGATLAGVSASLLAAHALVALELALGVFAMDLLRLTDLLPRLARLTTTQRRIVQGVVAAGLLLLAAAGAALAEPPLLGFTLPWVVALAALPLERVLDSGRPLAMRGAGLAASGLAALALVAGRLVGTLGHVLPNLYDAYVSIPLRIERALRGAASRRRVAARMQVGEEGAT